MNGKAHVLYKTYAPRNGAGRGNIMYQNSRKSSTYKNQNGHAFEAYVAELKGWRRDGRPGHTDLFDGKRRIECKFYTIKPPTAKKNAEYNRAHGIKANKEKPLVEQIRAYCRKYDSFCIGSGEDGTNPAEFFELNRTEAYFFFILRLQYANNNNGEEVGFCYGGKTLASRVWGRNDSIAKHGYNTEGLDNECKKALAFWENRQSK